VTADDLASYRWILLNAFNGTDFLGSMTANVATCILDSATGDFADCEQPGMWQTSTTFGLPFRELPIDWTTLVDTSQDARIGLRLEVYRNGDAANALYDHAYFDFRANTVVRSQIQGTWETGCAPGSPSRRTRTEVSGVAFREWVTAYATPTCEAGDALWTRESVGRITLAGKNWIDPRSADAELTQEGYRLRVLSPAGAAWANGNALCGYTDWTATDDPGTPGVDEREKNLLDDEGCNPVVRSIELRYDVATLDATGAWLRTGDTTGGNHGIGDPLLRPTSFGAPAQLLSDADGDGVFDVDDDCPGTANAGQLDADSDGAGDACDNCLLIPNGPLSNPYSTVVQCDVDSDGYGNLCDGDFSGDGYANTADNKVFQMSLYLFEVPPANPKADMTCDDYVSAADQPHYLQQLRHFFRGPSGYTCAGTAPCP